MAPRMSTGELRSAALEVLTEAGPLAYADAQALLNSRGLGAAVAELRNMKHRGEISMRLETDADGNVIHVVEVSRA